MEKCPSPYGQAGDLADELSYRLPQPRPGGHGRIDYPIVAALCAGDGQVGGSLSTSMPSTQRGPTRATLTVAGSRSPNSRAGWSPWGQKPRPPCTGQTPERACCRWSLGRELPRSMALLCREKRMVTGESAAGSRAACVAQGDARRRVGGYRLHELGSVWPGAVARGA